MSDPDRTARIYIDTSLLGADLEIARLARPILVISVADEDEDPETAVSRADHHRELAIVCKCGELAAQVLYEAHRHPAKVWIELPIENVQPAPPTLEDVGAHPGDGYDLGWYRLSCGHRAIWNRDWFIRHLLAAARLGRSSDARARVRLSRLEAFWAATLSEEPPADNEAAICPLCPGEEGRLVAVVECNIKGRQGKDSQ